MARKGKNKTLIIILMGAGAYLLLQQRNQPRYAPQYQNVPPPPSRNNAQDYLQWVALVKSAYGTVADLWKPGGPFYKEPIPQYDAGSQFWQDVSNVAGIGRHSKDRVI